MRMLETYEVVPCIELNEDQIIIEDSEKKIFRWIDLDSVVSVVVGEEGPDEPPCHVLLGGRERTVHSHSAKQILDMIKLSGGSTVPLPRFTENGMSVPSWWDGEIPAGM